MTFATLGSEIGALVDRKNTAYGSAFETSGAALKLLFPRGIPPEKFTHALLITRIWDKLSRVATDKDEFQEDPFSDIAGYGLLGAALARRAKQRPAQQPTTVATSCASPGLPTTFDPAKLPAQANPELCPRCGLSKGVRMPLCWVCYVENPAHQDHDLPTHLYQATPREVKELMRRAAKASR